MHYHPIKCINSSFQRFDASSLKSQFDHINSWPLDWHRFSAHWAKIKCSICSSKFDRFERDHVSFPWSNDFLSIDGQFRRFIVLPVMSRSGIALPPESARLPLWRDIYIYITNHSNAHVIEKTLATVARHSGFSSVHEWIFRLLLKISVDRSNYNES